MLFGFQILAILVLGLIIPAQANADRAGYVTGYNVTRWDTNVVDNDGYNYSTGVNTFDPSFTPVVYSGNATAPIASKTTVVKKTVPVVQSGSVLGASEKKVEDDQSLVASVVYGEDSFLPSGIIGWILLAIFILIIVILARKVFGGEKNFHSTPMKHA